MSRIRENFDQLIGSWQLNRTISGYGVASGVAKFTLINKNKIHYIENVEVIQFSASSLTKAPKTLRPKDLTNTLEIPGCAASQLARDDELSVYSVMKLGMMPCKEEQKIWQASREYFYEYNSDIDKIIKFFKDGRVFCELTFDGDLNQAQGIHLCELDNYYANYDFLSLNQINIKYKILGPNKNYLIETDLTKI